MPEDEVLMVTVKCGSVPVQQCGLQNEMNRVLAILERYRQGYETAEDVIARHGDSEVAKMLSRYKNLCSRIIAEVKQEKVTS